MERGVRPELEERPELLLLLEDVLEYPERGSLSVLAYLGSYLGSYAVRCLGSVDCY